MVRSVTPVPQRMRAAIQDYVLATDIADYLVKRGVPFRKAHGISARVSNYAREKGVPLSQLRVEEYRRFSPLFEEDILDLSIEGSVAARDIVGGTAPSQVAEALRAARRALLSTQEG